jgi:uncharacterized UBP type Zn finger protein
MVTGNCLHLAKSRSVPPRSVVGCEECLALGDDWVHLRLCLSCGHVGCCDESKNKHATRHYRATRHPVMQSLEPGESWRWCYIDEILAP